MDKIITELHGYLFTMQSFEKELANDGNTLHAYLIELTQINARAGALMAEYKMKQRQEKVKEYQNLVASQVANNKYFSITQGKDFIDSKCFEVAYVFDLAERTSRTAVHTIEAVRTILSSSKFEKQFAQYGT